MTMKKPTLKVVMLMNNEDIKIDKDFMESLDTFTKNKKRNAISVATEQMAELISCYDRQLKEHHVPYRLRKYLAVSLQSQLIGASFNRANEME